MDPIYRFLVAAALGVVCAAGAVEALEAGAAKVDITPGLGVPLNGYLDRWGRGNEGVHDPLWVRCLYLDDGATRVFWLTADLCVINRELRDRVLELAPKDVPPENIILTATHNHSGTAAMVKGLIFRPFTGRFMPDVLDATAEGFARAMQEAYDARRRATIGFGTGRQNTLTANRRVPDGPIDEQIGVIRVDDPDGNAIAILANLAAHPTVVPSEYFSQVSADYPGYFYTHLESLTSPECVAMFANGAEGNQRCRNPEDKSGWEHVESIGRLLATRVNEIATGISGADATLRFAASNPRLPGTLAAAFLPEETLLQALEIDDLLVTFYPGEPCVELGLEQRRRAVQRGYANQFTVGLSNDHLFYFVPREYYSQHHYESVMNFYGPGIAEWFYGEFDKLMSRGEAVPVEVPPAAASSEMAGGVPVLTVDGWGRSAGYQHGAAFRDALEAAYHEHVVARVDSGELVPDTGLWPWLPPFIDKTPLALPRLGVGARLLLQGLSTDQFDYLEGMAQGADMPFDAVWLTQCAPVFAAQPGIDARYRLPMCTMFAFTGDRAGAAKILAGRTLDWRGDDPPAVVRVNPSKGQRFYSIGFGWNAGVFTGMNEAGLVATVERVDALGVPPTDSAPVEFILRDILQNQTKVAGALQRLGEAAGLRGYVVLFADAGGDAAVVELGEKQVARRADAGTLWGVLPDDERVDEATRTRYARAQELLADQRIVSAEEVQAVLRDSADAVESEARIFSEATRHAVVFLPAARRMFVAFPGEDGTLTAFEELAFEGTRQ